MHELIAPFREYLESSRFAASIIGNCIDQLPVVYKNLQVERLNDIDVNAVKRAEKMNLWRITPTGIERCESKNTDYLLTLKYFLKYLEASGYAVAPQINENIQLPSNFNITPGGLTDKETSSLRKFLVFNVGSNRERRDTALMFLLLTTDISLTEALAIRVSAKAGKTLPCGDFGEDESGIFVNIVGKGKAVRRIYLATETLHFLNFYLENRSQSSAFLFCKASGKTASSPITTKSAQKILSEILQQCDIEVEQEQLLSVLRQTAKLLEEKMRKTAAKPAMEKISSNRQINMRLVTVAA
ncbi:MAG: hypothetical protein KDH95_16730 [Calditrichaeota bacterium]|nr:hypothetical protein [Calditrichota bacterium]MCB0269807.1 hypothetical protein [Calditrichota bacterium]